MIKLGFTGVYIIFLVLLKSIDCGTHKNRLGEAVLKSKPNLCFEQKYEFFIWKFSVLGGKIFYIFE